MKAKTSLISVIIPTRNRLDSLKLAVESVCSQEYKNIQIVIIDDCSDTAVTIDSFVDASAEIIIHRNLKKSGGAYSRNIGIDIATGEYISFLDDDDVILPNKFIDLLNLFFAYPKLEAASGEVIIRDVAEGKDFYCDNLFFKKNNVVKNRIHTNATLIKKESLGVIRYNESLEKFQDTQFNTDVFYFLNTCHEKSVVAIWNTSRDLSQITANNTLFFNSINYARLLFHFAFKSKIPPRYLYWHIYKFLSFVVRFK